MVTIETIVDELNSLPEPFLADVLNFIRATKSKAINQSHQTEKLEINQNLDQGSIDRTITQLLESFQTNEVSQETIDAEVEEVRAELYARKQAI
jgi:hypothetical protein